MCLSLHYFRSVVAQLPFQVRVLAVTSREGDEGDKIEDAEKTGEAGRVRINDLRPANLIKKITNPKYRSRRALCLYDIFFMNRFGGNDQIGVGIGISSCYPCVRRDFLRQFSGSDLPLVYFTISDEGFSLL